MESMSIGQYRSHDPPKNFAIRVRFSKLSPESVIPIARFPPAASSRNPESRNPESRNPESRNPESRNPELAEEALELAEPKEEENVEEDIVIHWQEKLFSAQEFEYYSDPLNCVTSLQKKYHEDIEYIKRTHGERQNVRIFTYVDCDECTAVEELSSVTLCENEPVSSLLEKMSTEKYTNMARKPLNSHAGLRRRGMVVNEPTKAMENDHVITTPSQRMQIMADVSQRVGKSQVNLASPIDDERMLCSIKIDANGSIVIKPDIIEEKEFKIECYHDTRSVYKYTLEDASIEITKLQKSQEAHLYNELYNRHAQLMHIHVGNELSPLPRSNELYVHSFFEIVSAMDFEYSSLYVQYLLDLPSGWKSGDDSVFGVTQCCQMNKENVAHFCFPFDFQLSYEWCEDDPDDFLTWPTLYLQVFSLDSWQRHRIEGYGYCQIPDVAGTTTVEVNTWRPKDDHSFSDMRRFFIGGTRELKDFTYVKNPAENEDEKLSRYYFKSVSAGSVVLRMNTLLQAKNIEPQVSAVSKWKKAIDRIGGYVTAVDSLSQVLDAFNRARKRMLSARDTLPKIM